jgi:hypothetical protein
VYACDCSRRRIGPRPTTDAAASAAWRASPAGACACGCRRGGARRRSGAGADRGAAGRRYGDLLIKDRDGHWTYQFAVTVDDTRQGITLVVRGADLVTPRAARWRWPRSSAEPFPPVFLHHPLVLHPDGRKLSKSSGDTGIRALRERGCSAEEVIGLAAAGRRPDRGAPAASGQRGSGALCGTALRRH